MNILEEKIKILKQYEYQARFDLENMEKGNSPKEVIDFQEGIVRGFNIALMVLEIKD